MQHKEERLGCIGARKAIPSLGVKCKIDTERKRTMETKTILPQAAEMKPHEDEQELRKIGEWISFIEGVCQERSPMELLGDKAWAQIEDGISPTEAYCLQEIEALATQVKELQKALKESKGEKRLAEKSPGSAASLYAAVQADPFIEGLMAAKRR